MQLDGYTFLPAALSSSLLDRSSPVQLQTDYEYLPSSQDRPASINGSYGDEMTWHASSLDEVLMDDSLTNRGTPSPLECRRSHSPSVPVKSYQIVDKRSPVEDLSSIPKHMNLEHRLELIKLTVDTGYLQPVPIETDTGHAPRNTPLPHKQINADDEPGCASFEEQLQVLRRHGSREILQTIVEGMRSLMSQSARQRKACEAVAVFASICDENRSMIAATGGIECIVESMRTHTSDSELQVFACTALANVSNHPDFEVKIGAAGGIECIVNAMRNHNGHVHLQLWACKALCNVAHTTKNKVMISAAGGVECIAAAMHRHTANVELQICACMAICNLSANPDIETKIAAAGGVECIIETMQSHTAHTELQLWACMALCNLSVNPDNKRKVGIAGGVDRIVAAMCTHKEHFQVQVWACKALHNITHSVPDNTVKLVNAGGIASICTAMWRCPANTELQMLGCLALTKIAVVPENNLKIGEEGGISCIIAAMHCADMDVRVAACHALCPVAHELSNKARIDEAGGIECLIQTMRSHIGHTQLQIFGFAALVSIAQSADMKVKHKHDAELQLWAKQALLRLSINDANKTRIAALQKKSLSQAYQSPETRAH